MTVISIPRPLAMRLMQIAQKAGDELRLGVVAARGGPDSRPDHYYPLVVGENWTAPIARAEADGRSVWALLIHQPGSGPQPTETPVELPAPRCLTTSLATRGVLQLHAWQFEGDALIERDLRLEDDS